MVIDIRKPIRRKERRVHKRTVRRQYQVPGCHSHTDKAHADKMLNACAATPHPPPSLLPLAMTFQLEEDAIIPSPTTLNAATNNTSGGRLLLPEGVRVAPKSLKKLGSGLPRERTWPHPDTATSLQWSAEQTAARNRTAAFRPKPHCLLLASSIPHRAKSLSRSQPRTPLGKIG